MKIGNGLTEMKQVINEEGSKPIKIWTDDVEAEALTQLKNLARLPFISGNGVACMPDVHAGKGSTIGTVIATEKAIIPAAVGVDIGCTDKDSEFLSPEGWVKISEYAGQKVMQYDVATGQASFVNPLAYVKKPSEGFYHFKTKYGIDQMLSKDHKVLTWIPFGREAVMLPKDMTADQVVKRHDSLKLGFTGKFNTTFTPVLNTCLAISDSLLRVIVMVCADGSFNSTRPESNYCVLRFKKQRKIERAQTLLQAAGLQFKVVKYEDGVVSITFDSPLRVKSFSGMWDASPRQLRIISDECLLWDGDQQNCFYTRDKASADFIQYAFSASGYRAVMRRDGEDYRVFAHTNVLIGIKGTPKSEINFVKSPDGLEYCFTVPSGYWVMRRNGNVVITGNCGMNAVRLSLKASDLPESLTTIRHQIERDVPLGAGGAHKLDGTKRSDEFVTASSIPCSVIDGVFGGSYVRAATKSVSQAGTLGSGNHFIELCIDENQDVWIMLHSGSRGIGNMIGSYFIEKAKKRMEMYFINLPDGDLAYLPEDTDDFKDYVEAVGWAQNYALENRRVMMEVVIAALRRHIPKEFTITQEAINCHHNYVEKENHFGRNMWVTRKGAIRARSGDLGIIPGSMGQKSYIVRGKGNAESYCSCSHGAGRKMSRAKARKTFTVEDLKTQTLGVECNKTDAVLDEIPSAYKDIDEVMANQTDLVEVVHTLKQVLCVKGA